MHLCIAAEAVIVCASCVPVAAVQLWIVIRGMESIRLLEKYSAPILIALSVALLVRRGMAVVTWAGEPPPVAGVR